MNVLLLSPDLFLSSRVAGLAAGIGGTLQVGTGADDMADRGPFEIVLVDLQSSTDPAALVATARQAGGAPAAGRCLVIAFGPHVATERLAAAKLAGADAVVSRGELLGGFGAVVRRCLASRADQDSPAGSSSTTSSSSVPSTSRRNSM